MRAFVTASFHSDGLERLRRHMDVVHEDWRETQEIYFDAPKLVARLRELKADVLIVEADLVHDDVLNESALRLIGSCRGDPVNVGLQRATELRIPVLCTPGRNADAVADLTLGYMLCLIRHIYEVNAALKGGQMRFTSARDFLETYTRYGGFELGSATVGIVGLGAIGRKVSERVRAFGARVLAYDPHVPAAAFVACGATRCELDEMLPQADLVTIHCPDVPATRNLIHRDRIGRLKKGAFFLNLARAAIVDDDALYEALAGGHLAGAAFDVFREEPVQPENRFVLLPNVLASPHLGGATRDVIRHQTDMIVDGIEAWIRGERPEHLANPEVELGLERPKLGTP